MNLGKDAACNAAYQYRDHNQEECYSDSNRVDKPLLNKHDINRTSMKDIPPRTILMNKKTVLSEYLCLCQQDMWLFYLIGIYFIDNNDYSVFDCKSHSIYPNIALIWRKCLFIANILYCIMGFMILLWAILIENFAYMIWGVAIILQCVLTFPILSNIKARFQKEMTFYEYDAIRIAISMSKLYIYFVLCSTVIYIITGTAAKHSYISEDASVLSNIFIGILLIIPFGNAVLSTWGLFFIILDVCNTYCSIRDMIHMLDVGIYDDHPDTVAMPFIERLHFEPLHTMEVINKRLNSDRCGSVKHDVEATSFKASDALPHLTTALYLEVYNEIKDRNKDSVAVCEYTTIVGYISTVVCLSTLFFPLDWEQILGACCIQVREVVLICIAIPYISMVNELHEQFCELMICHSKHWQVDGTKQTYNNDMDVDSKQEANNGHCPSYVCNISIDLLRLHCIATVHKPLTIRLLGKTIKKVDLNTQIYALCIVLVGFVVNTSIRHFVN